MAETWFTPKEWKARLVEFAGRRLLRNVANGESTTFDVSRSEGQVSQEGDAFNTKNMNDLEQRIANGFANAKTNIDSLNDNGAIKGMDAREDGVYITYSTGADTVTKKLGKTDRHVIKSGVGNGSFSVARQISGYEKLTAEDFAFVVTNATTSSSHRDSDYGGRAAYDPVATCSPALGYDASTGTITITGCAGNKSQNGPANSVENRGVGLTGTVYFYGDM